MLARKEKRPSGDDVQPRWKQMDHELDDGPVIEYFKNLAPVLAKDSQVIAVFFAVGDGSFVDQLSHEATPEFLAKLDICFDTPSVDRCRELNRKGLELAGCISPETAYPFQKRYLVIINESYRRFNAIQEDLKSRRLGIQP
jgi:hypothetical protein